jgi:hypothetical protein
LNVHKKTIIEEQVESSALLKAYAVHEKEVWLIIQKCRSATFKGLEEV